MKSIVLETAKIKDMFNQLQQNLGGQLNVDSKEHILSLDNEIGCGKIKGQTFKGGLSYLEFDMVFSEDFVLITQTPENSPICFAYCSKGKVGHSFGQSSEVRELETFQTGILTNEPHQDNVLYFKKGVNLITSLIVVSTAGTAATKKNSYNYRMKELFFKDNVSENSLYIGSYNLKIAEKFEELNAISQKGIVRSLLIEGFVHMILALEIQQHSDDLESEANKTGSLSLKEMDAVRELSKFISNYPETQLCIKKLSRMSGLSPSKLQEGFKLMHNRTVTDYIREVRIQKSEELIKNTDLNISEVVYSIGFTSRSYFSKIFKQKYNCSPKQYKDNQNRVAVMA